MNSLNAVGSRKRVCSRFDAHAESELASYHVSLFRLTRKQRAHSVWCRAWVLFKGE